VIDTNPNSIKILFHQPGHLKGITRILETNNFIFTGGDDGRVCIWDSYLKKEVACLYAHNYAISDVQKLNGLNVIATSSKELEIKLWSLDDFNLLSSTKAHSTTIIGTKPWKNRLISGSRDNLLKKWVLEGNNLVEEARLRVPDIDNFFIFDDWIVVSNHDGLVSIFDANGFDNIKYLRITKSQAIKAIKKASNYIKSFHKKDPHSLLLNLARRSGFPLTSFKTTEDKIILGHQFGLVSIWSKEKLKLIEIFFVHDKHITGIEIIDNSLFTTALDSSVAIYDLEKKELIKYEKFASRPLSLLKTKKEDLVIGLESGRIFMLNQKLEIINEQEPIVGISNACISPEHIGISFNNGDVALYNHDLNLIHKEKLHDKSVIGVYYFKNRFISVGEDNKISFFNEKLEVIKNMKLPTKITNVSQAKQYITLTSNQVLDLNKDEIIRGEISKQTESEFNSLDIMKFNIMIGDLLIELNIDPKDDDSFIMFKEFYGEEMLDTIRKIADSSIQTPYYQSSPLSVVLSERA
jgi:WD40 repeat protein